LLVTQNATGFRSGVRTTDVRFEHFIQCFGIIFGVDPADIFSDYQDILELVDPVTEQYTDDSDSYPYSYNWITVEPDNTTMCGRNR